MIHTGSISGGHFLFFQVYPNLHRASSCVFFLKLTGVPEKEKEELLCLSHVAESVTQAIDCEGNNYCNLSFGNSMFVFS